MVTEECETPDTVASARCEMEIASPHVGNFPWVSNIAFLKTRNVVLIFPS